MHHWYAVISFCRYAHIVSVSEAVESCDCVSVITHPTGDECRMPRRVLGIGIAADLWAIARVSYHAYQPCEGNQHSDHMHRVDAIARKSTDGNAPARC